MSMASPAHREGITSKGRGMDRIKGIEFLNVAKFAHTQKFSFICSNLNFMSFYNNNKIAMLYPKPFIYKATESSLFQEGIFTFTKPPLLHESRLTGGTSPNRVDLVERNVPVEMNMGAANRFHSCYP